MHAAATRSFRHGCEGEAVRCREFLAAGIRTKKERFAVSCRLMGCRLLDIHSTDGVNRHLLLLVFRINKENDEFLSLVEWRSAGR